MTSRHIKPWTERMLAAIERGPISREDVLALGMPLVPPGRAFRRTTYNRNVMRKVRGATLINGIGNRDADFWRGARHICNQSLSRLIENGRIIQFENEGESWFRMGRSSQWIQAGTQAARDRSLAVAESMRQKYSLNERQEMASKRRKKGWDRIKGRKTDAGRLQE